MSIIKYIKIKKYLPDWIVILIKGLLFSCSLLREYAYWFKKDLFQSSWLSNERSILAGLMVTSHVLEKGMTMPDLRYGFGYEHVREIITRCRDAITNYSENHVEIQSTLKDLEQYLQLHEITHFKLPEDIVGGIKELLKYKNIDTTACFECTPEELFKKTNDFFQFAHSRHTVRWYSKEQVDRDTLIKVVELAQTAPSACNRQSTKVYVIESNEKKEQVLKLQNGNRGFGHLANKILLITSDMKCWNYRHKSMAYIDGGIFVQNLLYALHYYEICACTLNAGMTIKGRKKLREIVGLSPSEIPIVFISIGKAPDHFMIAGSQRINVENIYKFL